MNGLFEDGIRITIEAWICLDGKSAVSSLVLFECGHQKFSRAAGDVFHHSPSDLTFGCSWHIADEIADMPLPVLHLFFQNFQNDNRVTGRTYCAMLYGICEFFE